jgi:hypothetical protein
MVGPTARRLLELEREKIYDDFEKGRQTALPAVRTSSVVIEPLPLLLRGVCNTLVICAGCQTWLMQEEIVQHSQIQDLSCGF